MKYLSGKIFFLFKIMAKHTSVMLSRPNYILNMKHKTAVLNKLQTFDFP